MSPAVPDGSFTPRPPITRSSGIRGQPGSTLAAERPAPGPTLLLLGPPRLAGHEENGGLSPTKATQLATVLVCREDWVYRDELLGLFWPEEGERSARANLSQLLYLTRRLPWRDGLEIERQRVRWRGGSDVAKFRDALGDGDWQRAVAASRGDLLAGDISSGPEFLGWLEQQRAELRNAWRDAALRHADALIAERRADDAATLLTEALRRDPLAEDGMQALLRCALEGGGTRDAALAGYDAFRELLERELEAAPLGETQALAERLRAADPGPASPPPVPSDREPPRLRGAPTATTPFVGRALELVELGALLRSPEGRLVTIVGPGGAGKTRLALQAAATAATELRDGGAVVPLAALDDAVHVPDAIATAFGMDLDPARTPLEQLIDALHPKRALLLLDNAEHLDLAGLVFELLDAALELRMVITSRTPLDLPGEILFDLGGLAYPEADTPDALAYDAVALFVGSARRIDRYFPSDPATLGAVLRLCRLLDGLPLGIELAATWTRMLAPSEIADELERNTELLRAEAPGRPERQRSLSAAFDHSWSLLSDAERAALLRLAPFRGGFGRAAAQSVTGAELRTLLSLVDASLLRRTPDGRFERHGVVQQLSEARLDTDPELAGAARQRHATHFSELAKRGAEALRGPEFSSWLERLDRDLANLRAALAWLGAERPAEALEMAVTLFQFWNLRGHYREGRATVEALLEAAPDATLLRAKGLGTAGALAQLCEDYPAARLHHQASLELYEALGHRKGIIAALGNLALLERVEGDVVRAREQLERVLSLQDEEGDERGQASTLNNLAAIAESAGDHAEARRLNRESLTLARRVDAPLVVGRSLTNLAADALDRGAPDPAERNYREALEIWEEAGSRVGIAVCRQGLAGVALARGELATARSELLTALELFASLEDRRGVGEVLLSAAELAAAGGDSASAVRLAEASLRLRDALGVALMPRERETADRLLATAAAGDAGAAGDPDAEGIWDADTTAAAISALALPERVKGRS